MKGYAEKKKNKKWSVAKVKVVDSPAVSEVKDDKGVVVRSAQAEISHEVVKLNKKRWDAETGEAVADESMQVDEVYCDNQISSLTEQIADLTAEKDGWTALKADIKAL